MPRVVAKLNARVRAIWTLLRWQKGISNAELRALSGLESVQASRTLAALAEKFPGAIEIDRSEKRWQLSDLKVARELGGGLDEYLAMVMGANLEKGWLHDARPAFINPDEVSIALVRQACLQKMGIDVSYVSLTSGETKRTLFPHALVRTAARWHVRAWCPEREEYRDFNVGRMSKMTVSKADRDTNLPEDSAWNEYVSLRIWPHTDLSSEQVKAVRREYFNGTAARVLKVRRALAPYVVQDLRVATDPATQRPPEFLLMVMPSEAAPAMFGNSER